MSNLTTIQNDEARPEVDVLLHDYFQAEMPHPWPTFEAPSPMRTKTPTSTFSRSAGRLALAGSVAVLVFGYLTLGAFFPRLQVATDVVKQGGEISHRDKPMPKHNQPIQEIPE